MKIINIRGKWYMQDGNEDISLTQLDENKVYEMKSSTKTVRTYQANRALHKYYSLVAESLNDAGYSVQFVLNKKRNDKIEKVFDWLYSVLPINVIISVKEKILGYESFPISWTTENVKNLLWRTFQKALVDKESTTKISSKDIDVIYKHLDKYLSENYGIDSIEFPSIESMIFEQNYKE